MKTSPNPMKTYLIPTPRREMVEITEENNPYLFQIMQDRVESLTPLADIAHLTFYETFQVLHSYRQCSYAEMEKAGAYLIEWLLTQEEYFERARQAREENESKDTKESRRSRKTGQAERESPNVVRFPTR